MRSRVAVVTGGTRGIGLGIAECLARDRFQLMLCGIRAEASVADALNRVRSLGVKVCYCQADVSRQADRSRLVAEVKREFGSVHVLVNNAGIAPRERRDILEASEESFDEVVGVNLKGPYFLTQAFARWMIDPGHEADGLPRCIVNISSISAVAASPNRGEYCISKAGISMATKLWAVRLAEYGILVYEVQPGLIRTDMTAGVQEKYDDLIAKGLLLQSRWGSPDDVGKTVAALARGDLQYSTGTAILVDGGMCVPRL